MHALITGGTGFLGKKLAAALLREPPGVRVSRVTLFDAGEGFDVPSDPRISVVTGDVADPAAVAAVAADADLVWHLAAVVSFGAERDVDLGYRVNLDGTRVLLEALRAAGRRPRLVFASSYAVFGGDLPAEITDDFHATPQSSYGTQKAIGELLVADYARKGFVDGRSLRLPTIVVRPGRPNLAASTFASSIIREPLAGSDAVCPVGRDTAMLILSPRRVVESLVRAMALPASAFGSAPLSLPGLCVTVEEMVDALERVAGPAAAARIRWEPDPAIQRIVQTWPVRSTARRAEALGFTADSSFDEIVRAHLEDEGDAGYAAAAHG
jgi:nucleoside-diphosphate-sugar epimerase